MKRYALRSLLAATALILGISLLAAACGDSTTTDDTTTATDSASVSGKIVVSGLVDYPMTFVTLDTDYMNWVTVTADDPDTGSADFDGVQLSEVFSYVGVQSDATSVVVTAYDGTSVDITLADISEDALLTVTDDDAFNLVMPGMDSEAWVKDVVKMEFK